MVKKIPTSSTTLPPPPPPEVTEYMLKDIPELKRIIFPLWRDTLSLHITIKESLWRKELTKIESKYKDCAVKWVRAVEKVTDLNTLISHDDPEAEQKIGLLLVAGYLKQMEEHEGTLSRIMRDYSESLRAKRAEADYKRTLFISTVAIILAALSIILSVYDSLRYK